MKTLLPILLAVVAIGAVIWALMPSEAPPAPAATASATGGSTDAPAVAKKGGPAALPAPRLTPASGRAATDRAVKVAQGKVNPDALRAALTAKAPGTLPGIKDDGPAPNLNLPPDPHANAGPSTKWGRRDKPPLTVSHAQVKDSVRAFYGNAPKNGPVPPARLDEVFSPEIIAEMNLPPDGKLIELGAWPATDRRGFEEVLAIPDGQAGSVGITVDTPDGRVRDYVFVGNPNNTTP